MTQNNTKVLIIDNADPVDRQFNEPLFKLATELAACDIVSYADIPAQSVMSDTYAAVIMSGVPLHYSFESVEERLGYYQWIHHTALPVLGICLGHQLIGKLFGGEIIRDVEAENGILATQVVQDDPLFTNITSPFESFMMHRASVTVPAQFTVLARTVACGNVIMKHKQKDIYGFQAHPELSPNGSMFIRNFLSLAPSDVSGLQPMNDALMSPEVL